MMLYSTKHWLYKPLVDYCKKHFSRKNIGSLTALHSKSTSCSHRIKIIDGLSLLLVSYELPNLPKYSTASFKVCSIFWSTTDT